jgi:hypothetical protein
MFQRFGLLVALCALTLAGSAWAQGQPGEQFQAAIDLHPVFGLSSGIDSLGFGFDVRGGYAMALEGFTLVPEGVLGYTWFGTGIEDVSSGLFRFMGGARAIFEGGGGVIPSAYAHLGFGSLSFTQKVPFGLFAGSYSASTSTAVLDFGGALDFPVAENLLMGGHAGFNVITAGGASTFLNFGAQASYRF